MENNLILAAGGIVEKRTAAGTEIAVVYRSRYGGEWGLPKGKLEKGESLLEAAQREVREETGYPVKMTGFAGTTSYYHGTNPKVVLFWRMTPAGEPTGRPSNEVQQVQWLSPSEAIDRLQHKDEKELVRQLYGTQGLLAKQPTFQSIKGLATRLFHLRRWCRLAGAVTAYEIELDRLAACKEKDTLMPRWLRSAQTNLSVAKRALRQGDIDKGWKCFQAAQRMELFGLESDDQLRPRAIAIRNEAEKLTSWRHTVVYELLGGTSEKTPHVEKIYVAALIRDEHYENQAYKDGLLRTHITTLCLALGIVLSAFFLLLFDGKISLSEPGDEKIPWMFVSVAVFGLLGGTVSAMLKAPTLTKSSRIPELTAAIRLTVLRLFMSMGSAIVIYVFLKSNLVQYFKFDFLTPMEPYTIYAVSFVAGFSERLVMRAVGYVGGK